MFFPERIVSIKDKDMVLEVGPGGTPHPRSDVLLEKRFDEKDAWEQRGRTTKLKTKREIIYYDGGRFPFDDNAFDYVICSHVLEHIPGGQISMFLEELQRVAKRGYLEFPTVYYDYMYNFSKHLTFLTYEDGVIKYLGKEKTALDTFIPIQVMLYETLIKGYDMLVQDLKEYFFLGFEWQGEIVCEEVDDMADIVLPLSKIKALDQKKRPISCKQKIAKKLMSYLFRQR